jgi:hypothetical protein
VEVGNMNNENNEGRGIWLLYFIYLYGNKRIKPAEIVLRREDWR